MKLGRNDMCWCHSGRKYKACHMNQDEKMMSLQRQGAIVPSFDMLKTKDDMEGMRKAGAFNTELLDYISPFVKEGITTEEINRLVHEYTIKHGAIPACLNYQGYPKSVCTSIDDVVCHGIPDANRILQSGDIVNIDCTSIVDGYYGDSSRMYLIGDVSEEKKKLVQVTKECLELGVSEVKPWGYLGDIGYVINEYAEKNGYSVVREIGGHGIGKGFHEEPWVSHIGQRGKDILLVPGMTFTIEPMINMGGPEVFQDEEDGWTIYTEDGSPSAQWEYTIAVTEDGCEILAR